MRRTGRTNRTIRLTILLSAKEREVLEELAEKGDSFEGNISPAAYMRWLLHQAAAEHGMWPTISGHRDGDEHQTYPALVASREGGDEHQTAS